MRPFALICLCMIVGSCHSQPGDEYFSSYDTQIAPYKFNSPNRTIDLHRSLMEISGLAMTDNGLIAAIEDETGHIYFLDLDGKIVKRLKFGGGGDYESIEQVEGRFYVMESNGDLTSFEISGDEIVNRKRDDTPFNSKNDVEGLGRLGDRLLVACKAAAEVEKNDAKDKAVYLMDTDNNLEEKPFITIEKKDLEKIVQERFPDIKIHEFDPSGIAVHPETGQIFVLSADHILLITSPKGVPEEVILLDKRIYPQPEGICFQPDGDLILSSEGDGKKAKLYILNTIK